MKNKEKKDDGKSLVDKLKDISLKPIAILSSAVALAFVTGCNPVNYKVAFHPNGDKMVMGMMQYNDGTPNVAYSIWPEFEEGNKSDLYIMDIDGKDLVNITQTKDDAEYWPSFSPGGDMLAYYSFKDGNGRIVIKEVLYDDKTDIYILGKENIMDGGKSNTSQEGHYPEFSPDGQEISFIEKGISIYNLDTGKTRNINLHANPEEDIPSQEESIFWVGWSPDSKKLAALTDGEITSHIPSRIYIFDRNGNNIKKITKENTINFWPEWDKDSKHIYFVSNMKDKTPDEFEMIEGYENSFPVFKAKYRNKNIKNENFHIYRKNIETGNLKLLTPHSAKSDTMSICPELSQNGKIIAYVERKKSQDNIWLMDRNGENKRKLTKNSFENLGPIWWTPNGDRLICVSSRGIFNVDAQTGNIEKITGYVESQARFIEMAAFFEDKLLEYATKYELQEAINNINCLIKDFTGKYDKLKEDFDNFKSGIENKVNKLWEEYQQNNPSFKHKIDK